MFWLEITKYFTRLKFLNYLPSINLKKTKKKHRQTLRFQRNISISCNISNSSFERVEELKYMGTTLRKQNSLQEEIKIRLKSGNACYQSVQNILSSSLLSKNIKIKIYRTIILPVVFYGYETLSLTLREERRLRVFENRVLRKIFGPNRVEVTGERGKLRNEELNDMYSSPNIFGWSYRKEWDGQGM